MIINTGTCTYGLRSARMCRYIYNFPECRLCRLCLLPIHRPDQIKKGTVGGIVRG